MEFNDLDTDAPNSALTSVLIRAILESRRALRLAIELTQDLMQEGSVRQWDEDDHFESAPTLNGSAKSWALSNHSSTSTFDA